MSLVEYTGHSDIRPNSFLRVFGDDIFVHKDLKISLHLVCNIELLLAVTEYNTRVLRPRVIALPVKGRWVVHLEKELAEVFVRLRTADKVKVVHLYI